MRLFGSAARGEPAEDSDIDLIAAHADLDCAWRWDRRQESARLGEQAAGWPVAVVVADRPEREVRSALPVAFERHGRDQAWVLRARPVSPPEVRWDREMRLPPWGRMVPLWTGQ